MIRRRLGVNLNHVATLRQARRGEQPDPVAAASIAEIAGADLIIVQLREDRRTVSERDVRLLRQTVKTSLSLQMAPTAEMVKVAYDVKPDHVTLVPEERDEAATVDVERRRDLLKKHVQSLRDGDIPVSLFIDPDLEQVRAAHRIDAGGVILDCGKYSDARGSERKVEWQRLADAARAAAKLGMRVSAGGGLGYQNVPMLAAVDEIDEYQVGHAIVARALLVGLDRAVRDMAALLVR
jgi:pyridoxine 5-phosphate synthase